MVWVIAFEDVITRDLEVCFWREEIYDEKGDFVNYGNVKTFETKELCEKFILDYTDSNAYDFYSKEITEEDLKEYEKQYEEIGDE